MRELAERIAPGIKDPATQQALANAIVQHPTEAAILRNLGPAVREGRKLHPQAKADYERATTTLRSAIGEVYDTRGSRGKDWLIEQLREEYYDQYMTQFTPEPIEDLLDFVRGKRFKVKAGLDTYWSIHSQTIYYDRNGSRRWQILEEWLHGRVQMEKFLFQDIERIASVIPSKFRIFNEIHRINRMDAAKEIVVKSYILNHLSRYLSESDKNFLQNQINRIYKYGTKFGY